MSEQYEQTQRSGQRQQSGAVVQEIAERVAQNVGQVIIGKRNEVRLAVLGLLCRGHILLEDIPGVGKTMMARACAGQTKATFLKLAGPSLVQMYIGDGPKMVRDAFALAKAKSPTIIFIDEIDAIGTKRFDNDKSGDREVQRTMIELLNHLDG